MSKSRLRNLFMIAIWVIVAIGFSVTLFISGGPATYTDDTHRRLIGGVFLALGVFGSPLMRLLTRSKPDAEHVDRDERDDQIHARATNIGLIVVVVFVFLGSITLWDAYQDRGSVPVGWMWVMAYSTLILSHLAPALVSLILDIGAFRHAEG